MAQLPPRLRQFENRKGRSSSESIPDKLPFLINDYRHSAGVLIPELRARESWLTVPHDQHVKMGKRRVLVWSSRSPLDERLR